MTNKKIVSFLFSAIIAAQFFSGAYSASPTRLEVCGVGSQDLQSHTGSDKERFIFELSDKLGIPAEKFKFNLDGKQYDLVPIHDVQEHVECMKDIFVFSNPDYMKYYLSGKLFSEDYVENWIKFSEMRMQEAFPKSFTFIVYSGDEAIGRIGVGPLKKVDETYPEIGYALKESYSGKGITKAAVKRTLEILKALNEHKSENYDMERLRATAKVDNIASNTILKGLGFKLSDHLVNDGFGEENEYFYMFDR